MEQIIKLFKSLPESFIQGSGGNFSIKENGKIYIKPSGYTQDNVQDLSICDLAYLQEEYAKTDVDWEKVHEKAQCNHLKPSMELGFHTILPHKYVLHFHNVFMTTLTSIKNGPQLPYCTVDYACPGIELAKLVQRVKNEKIILLRNHGQIIQADSVDELKFLLEKMKSFYQDIFDCTFTIPDVKNNILPGPFSLLNNRFLFPDAAVFGEELGKTIHNKQTYLQFDTVNTKVAINLYTQAFMLSLIEAHGWEPQFIDNIDNIVNHPDEIYRRKICN